MNLKKWLSEFIKRFLVGGLSIKEALQLQKLNLMAKVKALINGAVIDGVKPDLTALFNRAKQYLQTTAHTWANAVSNGVLHDWGKNRALGWRHISVLDSRTSAVCTVRHGKLWDREHSPIGHDLVFHAPPLHPNCRSMLVPASLDEPFEGITGEDWVKSRSLAALQEQFGVGIGQMLYDGAISLHDAVRQGGLVPMTLGELKQKYLDEYLDDTINNLLAKAKLIEPTITADLKDMARQGGFSLVGLEHRLKSQSSLLRKIEAAFLGRETSLELIANNVNDVLRYTVILSEDNFVEEYFKIQEMLSKQEYNAVNILNTWQNNARYKGINLTIIKSGQLFELQFHTKQSFDLKNGKLHELYEEFRLVETTEERKEQLKQQMIELSKQIPNPKGISKIKKGKK